MGVFVYMDLFYECKRRDPTQCTGSSALYTFDYALRIHLLYTFWVVSLYPWKICAFVYRPAAVYIITIIYSKTWGNVLCFISFREYRENVLKLRQVIYEVCLNRIIVFYHGIRPYYLKV